MSPFRVASTILICLLNSAVFAMPGGDATFNGRIDKRAFSHPSTKLPLEQRLDFKIGRGFFRRLWVSAPSSTQAADGLGPLFNARACMSCHPNNGRGRAPNGPEDESLALVMHIDIPPETDADHRDLATRRVNNVAEPTYGRQLQNHAIAGHNAESRLSVSHEELQVELADGTRVPLRKPLYTLDQAGYGPLHPRARLSPRLAPAVIGLGLLEAIDETQLLNRADPDDIDGDGISGRPNRVWSQQHQRVMLGRFGHKAGTASVDDQSQLAFVNDIGLAVPYFPQAAGDCTARQPACLDAPDGNSPQYDNLEAHAVITDLVAFYLRHLAVPARRNRDDPDVRAGAAIFQRIGCASCHTPEIQTAADAAIPQFRSQKIRPYTDLLLHDLGDGLADHRPEGVANGREWRTAPLWGIGLSSTINGNHNFLHDGRARTLLEAILWHGGEAQDARDAMAELSRTQRTQLLKFLESI